MTEKENPLQHRLTKADFNDFLENCRAKAQAHLQYNIDYCLLICYLQFSGVILPADIAFYELNHTFKNSSLMRSRDEIMEDSARYYTVFIKKYATVIDSAFKNCSHSSQDYFDLPDNKIETILLRLVEEQKSERKYINEAAFGFQCSPIHLYWNLSSDMREKVGDFLVEIKYNDLFNIVDIIGKIKPEDAFASNNVYALTMITLVATVCYSRTSQSFSLYLADIGLLTTLTVHITEAGYQNYIQPFSMMVDYVLMIVHNISYHSDFKTKLKLDATKGALFKFPEVDNNVRGLLIMMSLVFIMDEHELGLFSIESNVINTMIEYMQEALDQNNRVYIISLYQFADCLSKLTIKSSNSSKIVYTEGALSALVNMLRYENVQENASAVRCIHALSQDSKVRSALLEFPDLVPAMNDLRKTTIRVKVKRIIDETLNNLRPCAQVSGAFAGPSLIAETSKPTEDIAVRVQDLPASIHKPDFGRSKSQNAQKSLPAAMDQHDVKEDALQISPISHQFVERGRSGKYSKNFKRSRSHSATAHRSVVSLCQLQNSTKHGHKSRPPTVNVFILDQSSHVTNLVEQEDKFTARGKSESLKQEDEQTIKRHWEYLIVEVDATHITTALISRGVFDLDDKRETLAPNSRRKRTEIMLLKLLNAGPGSAYKTFIEVLEIDHGHIVEQLRK